MWREAEKEKNLHTQAVAVVWLPPNKNSDITGVFLANTYSVESVLCLKF